MVGPAGTPPSLRVAQTPAREEERAQLGLPSSSKPRPAKEPGPWGRGDGPKTGPELGPSPVPPFRAGAARPVEATPPRSGRTYVAASAHRPADARGPLRPRTPGPSGNVTWRTQEPNAEARGAGSGPALADRQPLAPIGALEVPSHVPPCRALGQWRRRAPRGWCSPARSALKAQGCAARSAGGKARFLRVPWSLWPAAAYHERDTGPVTHCDRPLG